MEEIQKTIMLVEDEAIIAMDEAETLKNAGYNVITVSSGEAAISTVNKTPDIDLILMDINLGRGMDGTEAAERILQNHEIPIVFLSSHTSPEVVARTEKVTFYGYVVKNSGSTVLFASIRMAFRLNEAHQNLNLRRALLIRTLEERRQTEEKLYQSREMLKRSLDEKEVLLSELQHRMKNSLAIITRLIGLEADRLSDATQQTVLYSLRKRVIAISDLNEVLFNNNNLRNIRLDQYLNQICSSLMASYTESSAEFELKVELECISIDVRLAIPLGLILNELLTNAIKYAFPEKRSGTVEVRLKRDNKRMTMSVSDNGVGLPPGFDSPAGRGLGMELIHMLAEQIGAQVEHETSGGALFLIVIPFTDNGTSDAHSPMKAAGSC
ncbi:MAG: sensor histidine kinase [Candidatus Xenobiia bacterium LiM19]